MAWKPGSHRLAVVSARTLTSIIKRSPDLFHISDGLYFPLMVSVELSVRQMLSGNLARAGIPTQSDHEKWWSHSSLTLSRPVEFVNR